MPGYLNNKLIYLIIGFTFPAILCIAQKDKDSLLNVVKNSPDINARISAENRLTYYMMWTNIDSSRKMIDDLAPQVQKNGNPENQARFISLKGTFHWFNGTYDSAFYYYRRCMEFSKANDIKGQYKTTISNLGVLFNQLNIPDSALYYLNIALQLASEEKDTATMSKTQFDIGITFNKMNYNNLALENLLKAEEYFSKIHDTVTLALIYNSLGHTYKNIGDFEKSRDASFTALKYDLASERINFQSEILNNIGVNYWKNKRDLDSARYYIKKTIEMPATSKQPTKSLTYYTNLGGIEYDAGNYRQALSYLQKAQLIETPYEDYFTKSGLYVNLGGVWLALKNTDSAYYYLRQGLEMALKINAFEYVKNACKTLYETDSLCKNYLSAMKYFQLASNYADTISNVEVRNKIAELEIIYQTAQKDKENALLMTRNEMSQRIITKQRVLVGISLAALIIIFVFLTLLLRNQRRLNLALGQLRLKNAEIEKKQEEIKLKNEHLQLQKQELTELNQTKDKFFSIVAHDLKSPFNALLGFLEILENEFEQMNDAEKIEIIKILRQSSQNTYDLLINLLDWSRSQRGLIQNKPEILNLKEIANTAITILDQRSQNKEHHINNLITDNHIAFADPDLIQTVFLNLINNAIKFTPRRGQITITSQQINNFIQIAVSDNGIGIPNNKINKLFGIDGDFNRKGTDNEIGTGLGLKMFKDFVEIMGGTISVDSEEGMGSTFSFSVPAYESGGMRQS